MIIIAAVIVALVYLLPRALASPPPFLARLPLFAMAPAAAVAAPAPWRPSAVRRDSTLATTLALGVVETRRLLLSPIFAAALVIALLNSSAVGDTTEFGLFNAFALSGPAAFWCGLICFFGGHLAAGRIRRDGAVELASSAPASPRLRVLAIAMAAVAAAAVILFVLVVGYVYWWEVRDVVVARPGVWHVLSVPVQVIGGTTLGVMIATWAPYRGVAPVAFVALVAVHIALADADMSAWSAYFEYARWPDQGGGFEDLSAAWHVAYMALLSGMAVVGAMVWLPGRRRGLLVLGALLTLGAAGAGVAQFA